MRGLVSSDRAAFLAGAEQSHIVGIRHGPLTAGGQQAPPLVSRHGGFLREQQLTRIIYRRLKRSGLRHLVRA